MLDNTEKFWSESWMKHIENYLNATPRAGIFINNYFKDVDSILEIAGGSCRDSRYLANNGYEATGSDFDDNVFIASVVKIISANHDFKDYTKHTKAKPIKIGNNVWIGANAVILSEVEIANGCIIGAGAVVTKSFLENNKIIVGNPARVIKDK